MAKDKLQSFKDLNVWQKSSDLATLIYKITKKFPHSEMIDGLIKSVHKSLNSKFHILIPLILLYSISYILTPSLTMAATLLFEPQSQTVNLGDTFIIEARIDTEGEEINVVEANIKFGQEFLEYIDFSKGESILTLWLKDPMISAGQLSFIGGIPGGFKGGGIIGRIILKGKGAGRGNIAFEENSKVLLNDGLGTPAKILTRGADFAISAERLAAPRDKWREETEKDKIPPEPFEIKIAKEAAVFDDKYFISFSAIDRQTGIDHYEIREGKKEWKTGKSPYLLEDQDIKSKISVKAVDKAGNERIAEYIPAKKPFSWWLTIILILFGIGAIWRIIKRRIKK